MNLFEMSQDGMAAFILQCALDLGVDLKSGTSLVEGINRYGSGDGMIKAIAARAYAYRTAMVVWGDSPLAAGYVQQGHRPVQTQAYGAAPNPTQPGAAPLTSDPNNPSGAVSPTAIIPGRALPPLAEPAPAPAPVLYTPPPVAPAPATVAHSAAPIATMPPHEVPRNPPAFPGPAVASPAPAVAPVLQPAAVGPPAAVPAPPGGPPAIPAAPVAAEPELPGI